MTIEKIEAGLLRVTLEYTGSQGSVMTLQTRLPEVLGESLGALQQRILEWALGWIQAIQAPESD
jgi:hypothetical protein